MMKLDLNKLRAGLRSLDYRALMSGEMLAVEVGSDVLLAARVRRRGRHERILDFVSMERRNVGEDMPDAEDIRQIGQRLHYQGGDVVLVTPLTRTVQLGISAARAKKLRPYQLSESIRWEVEPFTGISGNNALVGVERGFAETDEVLLALEGEQDVDMNVAVIERNVFQALKQVCKRAGFKLARVYSPESCFFIPSVSANEGAAVFDVGNDLSSFAVLKGGSPKQISAYPIGRESLREIVAGEASGDVVTSLRFLLEQTPAPLPLVVTGYGSLDVEVVEWLDRNSPTGARALELRRENKLSEAGHDRLNAVYATVVGAAMRELSGGNRRRLGISDAVPLPVRLRNSVYLMPVFVAGLLALTLFGHYQWMVIQKKGYDKRIAELQTNLSERKEQQKQYDELEKESSTLRKDIELVKKRMEFVRGGADDNIKHLITVLYGLTLLTEDMSLEKVEQAGRHLTLSGFSERAEGVSHFAVTLQKQSWCRAISIATLEHVGEAFTFTLEVDLDDAQTDKT